MRKRILILFAIALALSANLRAQVTIGELAEPAKGALLDLNKTVKGGLTLSNVALTNLYTIPATFPGMSSPPADVNTKFTGAMVYHTGENGMATGIYVWNGTNWTPIGENCLPSENLTLTLTASPVTPAADTNTDITFTALSNTSARCDKGATYTWYKAAAGDNYGASFATTNIPKAVTQFAANGTYNVKVVMTNPYSSGSKSAETTVLVDFPGYYLTGKPCYDIKQTNDTRAATNAPARVATSTNFSVEANRTRTYQFYHGAYSNLSITLTDNNNLVKTFSQPAANKSNADHETFMLTFKDDIENRVIGATFSVKLQLSYTDKFGVSKQEEMEIAVQDALCGCPAKIANTGADSDWLIFQCHNLGGLDILTATQSIGREHSGDSYRWGAAVPSVRNIDATTDGPPDVWNYEGTSGATPPYIPYYQDSPTHGDGVDWYAANNPCPAGWRLPTYANLTGLVNTSNNSWPTASGWSTGTFNAVRQVSDYLYLPAAGGRFDYNGSLVFHGAIGYYWSSSADGSNGWYAIFNNVNQSVNDSSRAYGYSVRCVAVE
jgi:uncharacterized protein (TIGR02145 family)